MKKIGKKNTERTAGATRIIGKGSMSPRVLNLVLRYHYHENYGMRISWLI